jgi:hypothetical protein
MDAHDGSTVSILRPGGEERKPRRGSIFEEVVHVNSSFTENRAQRAFRHVSGMVRKRDLSPRLGMPPNFVATGTGTVELETKRSETAGNFPVGES